MGSRPIAEALETSYPTPSLYLESPYLSKVESLIDELLPNLLPFFVPLVPKHFLNRSSKIYYYEDRERTFGAPLDDLLNDVEAGLMAAMPTIQKLGNLLLENDDGPFLMGKEVSYADFNIVGLLEELEQIGWASRIYELDNSNTLKQLFTASQVWLERSRY